MRNVISRMIQEMAFPDHALSRSIRKRNACTRYPLPFAPSTTDGALGRPRAPSGYRPSDRLGARSLDLGSRSVRHRIGRRDVDRVGPWEDPLGPGLLRLQDRAVVGVV